MLFHPDRNCLHLLHADWVVEDVYPTRRAVTYYIFGRRAHADRNCAVFAERTPVCVVAYRAGQSTFHPYQFLPCPLFSFGNFIPRHLPFESSVPPPLRNLARWIVWMW